MLVNDSSQHSTFTPHNENHLMTTWATEDFISKDAEKLRLTWKSWPCVQIQIIYIYIYINHTRPQIVHERVKHGNDVSQKLVFMCLFFIKWRQKGPRVPWKNSGISKVQSRLLSFLRDYWEVQGKNSCLRPVWASCLLFLDFEKLKMLVFN